MEQLKLKKFQTETGKYDSTNYRTAKGPNPAIEEESSNRELDDLLLTSQVPSMIIHEANQQVY